MHELAREPGRHAGAGVARDATAATRAESQAC
jgi:hypothetical protein